MAPQTLPLTVLDEVFLNLDETVTWSVQFEVRVSGRFAADRLRTALRDALSRHPMGRAELAWGSWNDRRRHWRIADEPTPVDLPVQLCERPGDLDELRARLYDDAPDLAHAPLLRAAVARDVESDVLLLNLHSVAFDGMSAARLMTSIARGYAGEPDEPAGPPLAQARDLRRIAGSQSLGQQVSRAVGLAGDVVERRAPIARISGSGGAPGRYRFGVTTLRLDADETAAAIARRPDGNPHPGARHHPGSAHPVGTSPVETSLLGVSLLGVSLLGVSSSGTLGSGRSWNHSSATVTGSRRSTAASASNASARSTASSSARSDTAAGPCSRASQPITSRSRADPSSESGGVVSSARTLSCAA